jgi:hypothetical protein
MKTEVSWKFIALWIAVCLLIGITGSSLKAQNLTPIADTSIVYRLDDFSKWEYLPNVHPVFELDETIEAASRPSIHCPPGVYKSTIDQSGPAIRFVDTRIKSYEYHHGTPWIAERNKSAIIEYHINLIAELMEPGETITIKKVE